ncbi:MAG TPA: transcription antitermination factor NusB [Candidatus Hydrogenedentes bacterium]|nr:transcription antitermination factor NusB [Candidatus Hydrogenedentota bacterium]
MKFPPRTLGRALAVQSLYGAAFSGNRPLCVLENLAAMGGVELFHYRFDDEEPECMPPEIPPDQRRAAVRYARRLLEGVEQHLSVIDPLIESHLIGWSRERVGRLEWAILQTAICEMLFLKTVDPPIAIDQAITLAKWLAQEDAARFINGVLDAVAKSSGVVQSKKRSHDDELPSQ